MPKHVLSFLSAVVTFLITANSCVAQYRIPLDSVAKFTFVSSAPWWNGPSYYKVEIMPEDGKWKVYQLASHKMGLKGEEVDTTRRYCRDMAKQDMANLLKYIGSTDTALHPKLFKVDKAKVIAYGDRMMPLLTKDQRTKFIRTVDNKKKLDSAILYVVRYAIAHQSDLSGYLIQITTKGKRTYNVTGYANYQVPAHLPWTIGKVKSMDPRISFVFEKALHGDKKDPYESSRMYGGVELQLYLKYLQKGFMMQNLERQAPLTYQELISNFSPAFLSSTPWIGRKTKVSLDSLTYSGYFHSAKLPSYMEIGFRFKAADTISIRSADRMADTVAGVWGTGIPFFDQLKKRPGSRLIIDRDFRNNERKQILKALTKTIPNFKLYDPKQIFVAALMTTDNEGIRSTWVLLPDRTIILCKYFDWDYKPDKATARFMGLDPELIKKHYEHSTGVVIHLDALGKLIKDHGEVPDMPW